MTLNQAIEKARVAAKKYSREYWVIFEADEGYQIASEYDLDTYFLGCSPVAYVNSAGREE